MDAKHAGRIAEAASDIGIDVRHRDDYSGRYMYGEQTDGVVGDLGNIIQAVAGATAMTIADGEDADDFIAAMGRLRFDNMGRSAMIVY